jgi:UDP-N-acetylmuramoyl-tripeptide--D-alanyl-D-alanine ligase
MNMHEAHTFWSARSVLQGVLGSAGEAVSVYQAAGSGWVAARELAEAGEVVCTDSRSIQPGQIFAALRGARVDGHDFIRQVMHAGAGLIISEKNAAELNLAGEDASRFGSIGVVVPSTVAALQNLARAYRRFLGRRGCRFFAVCGSNGKTTTVRMIDAMARATMRVTASQKSFNNHLGVPLTILSAKEHDEVVICEAGTNHPGELDLLGSIIQPDALVYTSIGREHLEGFGTLEGVMREEASMARHVATLSGFGSIVSNVRMPAFTRELEEIVGDRLLHRGGGVHFHELTDEDVRDVKHVVMDTTHASADARRVGISFVDRSGVEWKVPIPGAHNAGNAAIAAYACSLCDGEHEPDATPKRQSALATATLGDMRLMTERIDDGHRGVEILNDAYNANPESMLSSLATFADLRRGIWRDRRGVMILGEMRELGEQSIAMHAEIVSHAVRVRQAGDRLLLMGGLFAAAAERLELQVQGAGNVIYFAELDDAAMARAASVVQSGDCVLLKASRGVRLERIVSVMRGGLGRENPAGQPTSTLERAR